MQMYTLTHKNIHADRLACPPLGYLRARVHVRAHILHPHAIPPPFSRSDRRMTAAAAALEDDEEVRFATLPIFHCAVLSPRGRDGTAARTRTTGEWDDNARSRHPCFELRHFSS